MARKKDSATARTLSLFSGKTVLEEAEVELGDVAPDERTGHPLEMVKTAEDTAIRWLGLDVFHDGDDIKVAVHPNGTAVLVIVRTNASGPYGTATIKLSRVQWAKLRAIVTEAG